MRLVGFCLLIATVVGASDARHVVPEPRTIITGVVRTAITGEPIAGAAVFVNWAMDSALTDSAGRFVLRASRGASLFGVRKEGFLEFQYPFLQLPSDTLLTDVELRTDPPVRESSRLPFLCIVVDAPNRLAVKNSCNISQASTEYTRRIIKHNPWNPYFGPAGDRSGVLLATRKQSGL